MTLIKQTDACVKQEIKKGKKRVRKEKKEGKTSRKSRYYRRIKE
jgi:hypothetical protein